MARIIIEPQNANNVKSLVKSAVENEIKIIGFGIGKTKKKLEELEKKFGMDTAHFYKKFNEGEMGDDLEYIRWAGEYETLQKLKRDHNDLVETELCS
ncbi:MAG: hypothetical protein R6T98_09235 [Desulfatiglandales bacterium]|jgi:hypothetical protein